MPKISNLICLMHSGLGPSMKKEPLSLPDRIFVAFYAPPGRSLGTAYGNALYAKLSDPSSLPTMEALEQWHAQLQAKVFQKPITGSTDPNTLELYPELSYDQWPQVSGKNQSPVGEKPWNYFLFGPKATDASKDNFGLVYNDHGLKFKSPGANDTLMLQDVVDWAETMRSQVNGPDTVIHFLGCREEAKTDGASGSDLGNLFIEVQQTNASRQQIRLRSGETV